MNRRFLLAAFCSGMISTALLNGCGLFDERPHNKAEIEEFVTDIDKDATVDYKSREKLKIWGRPYYSYDAVIGGIECQVLDACRARDEMCLKMGYDLQTDYPHKLCEELWDDIREDYPDVGDMHVSNSNPDLRLAYDSVGVEAYNDDTDIWVDEEDDDMTEELFDEYWDFYCDLMDAMEDYPEFSEVSMIITNEDRDFHIVFLNTDEEVYEEEYKKLFGDS